MLRLVLRLRRRWATDRTVETLVLHGDDYKMMLGLVDYSDPASPLDAEPDAKALDDL